MNALAQKDGDGGQGGGMGQWGSKYSNIQTQISKMKNEIDQYTDENQALAQLLG